MLCGCQRESVQVSKDFGPVRFQMDESTYSFTTKATENGLENGDKVQILAGAPINAASEATVGSDAKLTLTTPIYWAKDQTVSTNFVAIYPGQSQTTAVYDNYSLMGDPVQDYNYHNLFMAASKTAAPGNVVALTFKHPFSKILVNITNQLNADPVSKVTVKGVVMDGALNLQEETVTLATELKDADAVKLEDNKYALIVMPQTASPSLVVTTESGKTFKFVLAQAVEFKAGTYSSASLTLKESTTPPDPQHGDAVSFSFEVAPWAEGDALEYGDGAEYTPSWAVCGKLNGAEDWVDDAIVMTQTATGTEAWEGTWEADIDYKAGDTFKLRWNCDWAKQAGMSGEVESIGLGESGLWGEGNKDIVFDNTVEDGAYHLVFVYDGYKLTVTKK